MIKTIRTESPEAEGEWIKSDRIAEVEVTSEQADSPVELAFDTHSDRGWRAGEPGRQHIRIRFHQAETVKRIRLVFEERSVTRTQEFTLGWTSADGSDREIVRQQWTFDPNGSQQQSEDYHVDLHGVKSLHLAIRPDLNAASDARASLRAWRIA